MSNFKVGQKYVNEANIDQANINQAIMDKENVDQEPFLKCQTTLQYNGYSYIKNNVYDPEKSMKVFLS